MFRVLLENKYLSSDVVIYFASCFSAYVGRSEATPNRSHEHNICGYKDCASDLFVFTESILRPIWYLFAWTRWSRLRWQLILPQLAPPLCKKKSHMTCDTWHVTHDTWHVTLDMWHTSSNRSIWEPVGWRHLWASSSSPQLPVLSWSRLLLRCF